jgi:HK97 family phage major capsid protein
MANVRDLKERRAKAIEEMRQLADNPRGSNGDLDAEQAKRFDELRAESENLEKQIERQAALDEAERRMNGEPMNQSEDRKWEQARREYRLTTALAGAAGLNVDDGREREIQQEMARRSGRSFQGIAVPTEVFQEPAEQRALTSSGDGSDLIATDHMQNQFIDRLRENVVVRSLGARVLRDLTGNVDIPKLSASSSVGWVAENTALSESDHAFASVGMSPKHAGAITELSRNMLQQSSPDIERLVRNDFAQILGSALDSVAIKGGGTDEPTGILSHGSVPSVDLSGGVTWGGIQSVIGTVEDADASGSAFLTNPKVGRVLRTTNKVSGEPAHGFIQTEKASLDGYPLRRTTLVPVISGSPDNSDLIFGNFADLMIGFWSELDLLVNPYEATAYSKGNVKIRAMMTADVALRHPESFAYGTGIDVSGV